jgi:hypothetical protein
MTNQSQPNTTTGCVANSYCTRMFNRGDDADVDADADIDIDIKDVVVTY